MDKYLTFRLLVVSSCSGCQQLSPVNKLECRITSFISLIKAGSIAYPVSLRSVEHHRPCLAKEADLKRGSGYNYSVHEKMSELHASLMPFSDILITIGLSMQKKAFKLSFQSVNLSICKSVNS
jgi:hypothetical protein